TADLKQADVALAMIQIPFQCSCHGHDSGRSQYVRFFRERVGKTRGRNARGTEQHIALFRHVRNRQYFAVAETDQAFAQTYFGLVMREARRALARLRKPRRKSVEAVNSRDFFGEVYLPFG